MKENAQICKWDSRLTPWPTRCDTHASRCICCQVAPARCDTRLSSARAAHLGAPVQLAQRAAVCRDYDTMRNSIALQTSAPRDADCGRTQVLAEKAGPAQAVVGQARTMSATKWSGPRCNRARAAGRIVSATGAAWHREKDTRCDACTALKLGNGFMQSASAPLYAAAARIGAHAAPSRRRTGSAHPPAAAVGVRGAADGSSCERHFFHCSGSAARHPGLCHALSHCCELQRRCVR
jgi:hypothetical protein